MVDVFKNGEWVASFAQDYLARQWVRSRAEPFRYEIRPAEDAEASTPGGTDTPVVTEHSRHELYPQHHFDPDWWSPHT